MPTEQQSIDWYNQNAAEYTQHVRNPDDSIFHSLYEKPAIYSLLPDLAGKSVLSLGCGSGEDSKYLKDQGACRSVGIDISEKLIDIAASTYPDCEFRAMDMERLDFPDNSFDFAFSSQAIHYLEDWFQALKGIHRVLQPNSYFLFSCNHPVATAMRKTESSETKSIKQLAFIENKQEGAVEVIGDYLNRQEVNSRLIKSEGVTTWHKPMSEIISESLAAGFSIDCLMEPRPLEKMKEVSPIKYYRLSKVPFFLILRLHKL